MMGNFCTRAKKLIKQGKINTDQELGLGVTLIVKKNIKTKICKRKKKRLPT